MKLYRKIGKRWKRFIVELRKQSETVDQMEIHINKLVQLLSKYSIYLTAQEKESLLEIYPGWDEGKRILINLSRFFTIKEHFEAN